jgi:hypothetical protein
VLELKILIDKLSGCLDSAMAGKEAGKYTYLR